jgi:hypothetical protein
MGMEWSFRRLIASEVAEAGSMRNLLAAQRAYYHPTADCSCLPVTTVIDSKTGHTKLVCRKMKEEK